METSNQAKREGILDVYIHQVTRNMTPSRLVFVSVLHKVKISQCSVNSLLAKQSVKAGLGIDTISVHVSCLCLGVFVGLGLSGVVPSLHFVISEGLIKATTMGQMGWLLLMATLYITGACLYAARIPERFFPGKCDIWVSD